MRTVPTMFNMHRLHACITRIHVHVAYMYMYTHGLTVTDYYLININTHFFMHFTCFI